MNDEEGPGSYGSGTESDQDAKLDAKVLQLWLSLNSYFYQRAKKCSIFIIFFTFSKIMLTPFDVTTWMGDCSLHYVDHNSVMCTDWH
jgi:hypothetical protein